MTSPGIMALFQFWSHYLGELGSSKQNSVSDWGVQMRSKGHTVPLKTDLVIQIAKAGLDLCCDKAGTVAVLQAMAELATQDIAKAHPSLCTHLLQLAVTACKEWAPLSQNLCWKATFGRRYMKIDSVCIVHISEAVVALLLASTAAHKLSSGQSTHVKLHGLEDTLAAAVEELEAE
jgi:hypothetical protein